MIRFLWYIVLLIALYWVLRNLFRKGSRPRGGDAEGEEMVRDPQCGVYLPVSRAVVHRDDGEKLYFCSERCRRDHAERNQD